MTGLLAIALLLISLSVVGSTFLLGYSPHSRQNLLSGSTIFPHAEQVKSIFLPHSKQNLEPSGILFRHSGQIMTPSY
jgi:hypothetical protein